MKRKLCIVLSMMLSLGLGQASRVKAQSADSLMKAVLEGNPILKVAREATQTAIMRAGTGTTPPDPQVEFGYLFSDPSSIGNKINIVVKQELDFPTAYVHRSRLRDIRSTTADLEYVLIRQQVLAQARQLWIQQVHLKQSLWLLNDRLGRARTIQEHMEVMRNAGEVGSLEYSQAKLVVVSLEGEVEGVLMRIETGYLALLEMTGGKEVPIPGQEFPLPASIVSDSLMAAYEEGPEAMLAEQNRLERESEIGLARSQHLPRISGGYFSEVIPAEAFRGFTVGISVPLWENTRKLKSAQKAYLQSQASEEAFLTRQNRLLRQKLEERSMLGKRLQRLEKALTDADGPDQLSAALEAGEISLTEYFFSSDLYFRNHLQLLEYKRDLLVLEADLLKVYF